jgi:hypothetical protein
MSGIRYSGWLTPTDMLPGRSMNCVLTRLVGVSTRRFQHLRHTAASLWLLKKVPAKVVSDRQGSRIFG